MSAANNFSLIRLGAAFAVMIFHSTVLVGKPQPLTGTTYATLGSLAVDVFFAVSGFLLASSLVRDPDPRRFVERRFLRIWPGLAVCVLATAFVIGPLFTTAERYLFDPTTWRIASFSLSIFGFEHAVSYPGLFVGNPSEVANGSLWSLPYEVFCYLGLLALHQLSRSFRAGILVALCLMVWGQLTSIGAGTMIMPGIYTTILLNYGTFFFAGAALAVFGVKPSLRKDALAAAIMAAGIAFSGGGVWQPFWFALVVFIPYAVLRLAFLPASSAARSLDRTDISYGVYLYHFPIMQAVVFALGITSAPVLLAVAVPAVLPIAYLSWTYVERPAMRRDFFRPFAGKREIAVGPRS